MPALRPWKRTYASRRRRRDQRGGHVCRVRLRRVDRRPTTSAAPRASAAARRECPRRTRTGDGARRATRRRRPGRVPIRGSRATTASRRRRAASGRGCRRACRSRAAARGPRGTCGTRPRVLAGRPVDAAAVVDGHSVAQLGRDLFELHRVPRHQPERLHVHDEARPVSAPPSPAPSSRQAPGNTSNPPRPSRTARRSRRAGRAAACPGDTSASRARRPPTSTSRSGSALPPAHPTIAPCPIPAPWVSSIPASVG